MSAVALLTANAFWSAAGDGVEHGDVQRLEPVPELGDGGVESPLASPAFLLRNSRSGPDVLGHEVDLAALQRRLDDLPVPSLSFVR